MKRKTTKTVSNLFERFLDDKKLNNMTDATITNYRRFYSLYDKAICIADIPIEDFSNDYLVEWYKFLGDSKLKPSTIKQYISAMRVFHLWLYDEGYIERKPKSFYIKTEDNIPRYYSNDEIKLLLKKPDRKASFEEYSTYVMICFILATGVRAATLVEIRISDIDFEDRIITLRHLKNRSKAIIPLSDKLYKVLKEYLSEFVRESGDTYLFCDRYEKQISTHGLRGRLHRYCNDRGVEFKDLHAFRHTFAKNYIANGGSIEKLQKLLTHKSLQMTAYYANIFGKDLQIGYENVCPLDNILVSRNIRRN